MAYKNEIIDDLCNLIRIDSVKSDAQSHMPYGKKVFEALMYMLNLAESLDLDNVNLFSRCGYVEYGEGDDLGRYRHLRVSIRTAVYTEGEL